jgi:hypothetical protein
MWYSGTELIAVKGQGPAALYTGIGGQSIGVLLIRSQGAPSTRTNENTGTPRLHYRAPGQPSHDCHKCPERPAGEGRSISTCGERLRLLIAPNNEPGFHLKEVTMFDEFVDIDPFTVEDLVAFHPRGSL